MSKLILVSVALVVVLLPLVAARDPLPMRGLKKALAWVVAFNLFYVFVLRLVVPRLE